MRKFIMASKKPKLIVFDLDYTLWPFWVDTHVLPPFRKESNGDVYDFLKRKIKYYPDVPALLKTLHKQGYILGIASRTSEIDGANKLLKLFEWDKYVTYKEIYPGSKVNHFNNFKKNSGIGFEEMLFFDDEERNITDLKKQGVKSILVRNGVDEKLVKAALQNFAINK